MFASHSQAQAAAFRVLPRAVLLGAGVWTAATVTPVSAAANHAKLTEDKELHRHLRAAGLRAAEKEGGRDRDRDVSSVSRPYRHGCTMN